MQYGDFSGVALDKYVRGTLPQDEAQSRIGKIRGDISTIEEEASDQPTIDKGHLRFFKRLLPRSLSSGLLPTERQAIAELNSEIEELHFDSRLPQLDLSFLSMSNKVEYEGLKILVPKFSVYGVFEEPTFKVEQTKRWDNHFGVRFSLGFNGHKRVGTQFSRHLVKATSIFKEAGYDGGDFEHSGKGYHEFTFKAEKGLALALKNESKGFDGLSLSSHLSVLVPASTRCKIDESKELFGRENMYFIAETEPERWNVKELNRDPLVVGLKGRKAYLIDKFDTSLSEDYVAREFTQ